MFVFIYTFVYICIVLITEHRKGSEGIAHSK